jgi:S-DNA-T family DNA segregation ATPase FtsK/SpoIIIE
MIYFSRELQFDVQKIFHYACRNDGFLEAEPEDELLPEAIELVRQLNKASTSLLQRRFRIGYTRAARLIDYMEDKGIIGPPTGTSKAREVILDGASPTENSSEEEE